MTKPGRPSKKDHLPATTVVDMPLDQDKLDGAMQAMREQASAAQALALELGYEGSLAIGSLEDEIRFYQRRTVEAIIESGKRLLLLKEITPRGDFDGRVELLGFSRRTAYRFMQAAAKTAKSAKLAQIAGQIKNASAFLELVTHDEDDLGRLDELDAIDTMSASELRAALREAKEEQSAHDQLLTDKNKQIDRLKAAAKRLQAAPPDEQLRQLQQEATGQMHEASAMIVGTLRQALIALNGATAERGDPQMQVFMAGLVGQLQQDLATLRSEFNLPDVSNAADQQLAAEVAQWAN